MAYRPGAFDHFDKILCVGPHHKDEIRVTEALHALDSKILLEGRYVVLDSARFDTEAFHDGPRRIAVVPFGGDNNLIESCGPDLVEIMLESGFQVAVRPNSMTIRIGHLALLELKTRVSFDRNFRLNLGLESQGTVTESDLMISDWSGAAIEYALGLEKPVIFVDVPKKVNNPDYGEITQVPFEVMLRYEIREIVPSDNLSELPAAVERLCKIPDLMRASMQELRRRRVYNIGSVAEVTAGHIIQAAE